MDLQVAAPRSSRLVVIVIIHEGNCKKRGEPCPDLIIKDDCQNITCPENEYFCYPQGCISTTLQCHQKCHNFGSLNQVPCGKECISKFEGYK